MASNRWTRGAVAHGTTVQTHLSAMDEVTLQDAGDDLRRLRSARADQAEYAGDLARHENGVLRTMFCIDRFWTLSTSPARRALRSLCEP